MGTRADESKRRTPTAPHANFQRGLVRCSPNFLDQLREARRALRLMRHYALVILLQEHWRVRVRVSFAWTVFSAHVHRRSSDNCR
jgi:hypothetical protein